jgi:hypothetical protein
VSRRIWVEEEQPVATVNWKRVAMAVWLCSTSDGETYWWVLKRSRRTEYSARRTRARINTKLFSRVLKDFAQHFRAGKNKRIILTLDQAGWHLSHQLEVPEGIHLVPLPPYSPELQPAERLCTGR